jgi:predicted ferric reductase
MAARQRRRRLRSDLMVAALWVSAAAAVALFLAYGGAGQFGSTAATLTNLGIITGLIGTDFILVMLVLIARIPLIDRTVGHDRAIAVHRRLGKPALFLLLAHGVLLLIGYGMSSGFNPITEIGPMLSLSDMPLAFIGTGLLIAVVVTSLVIVRRRLAYEAWHLAHLLSYIAVAIALPHQLSVGGMLATGTWQRVYWIGLYVIAFGAIATFRFGVPVVASLRHGIRVAGTQEVAPGVVSIYLTGRHLRNLGADGGQYFVWRFWTPRTWWHSHPISLSAMPTDSTARITVRSLGTGSARLSSVPVGTRVSIEGPYGLFSDRSRTTGRIAIAAAGIGVAPVLALLEQADFTPGKATVLLRASTPDNAFLWDEVRAIAAKKGAKVSLMIGPRTSQGPAWMSEAGAKRKITLKSVFPNLLKSDLYVCGPGGWIDEIERDAKAHGLPEDQLHSERFDW